MNWYLHVLRNYARFDGRARRAEYWWFALWTLIVSTVLSFVDLGLGLMDNETYAGVLSSLYGLGTLLPWLAVQVRRLHDTGRSGWWALLSMPVTSVLIVQALLSAVGTPVDADSAAWGVATVASLAGFLVLIALSVLDGQPTTNAYGPDPKGRGAVTPVAAWSDAGPVASASVPAALRTTPWQGPRTGKARTLAALLVLALAGASGFALWLHDMSTAVKAGITTGRQEGFTLTQVGCVDRAIERAKRGAALRPDETSGEAARLLACLETSERVSGFCAEVPGAEAVLDRVSWTQVNCSRIDAPRQHCIQLLDAVVNHCSRGAGTGTAAG